MSTSKRIAALAALTFIQTAGVASELGWHWAAGAQGLCALMLIFYITDYE